ncbi:MAG: preprotein translocase subunit SecE [Sphingomonadales bacterium]|nr:preprotein translocase subunit SecE [Sphingomonadales bacterium]MDE2168017.1 preprotein translocase subunit SecE [Sphingomonadales bacterium]
MSDRAANDGAKLTPGEFINQVKVEARKVVWPTRKETVSTGIFVGVLMIILALFFLSVDTIFGKLVQFLLSLA